MIEILPDGYCSKYGKFVNIIRDNSKILLLYGNSPAAFIVNRVMFIHKDPRGNIPSVHDEALSVFGRDFSWAYDSTVIQPIQNVTISL